MLSLESKKVSIIISAFNAEKYLSQTLDSVLAQTYSELEVIVVNDGSTDSTLTILESYHSKGVLFFSQENKGQDAALNFGFKHSTGDYIKFMDSDDLINPEMIESQMKVIQGSQDYVAYGEWSRFYKDDIKTADFKNKPDWNLVSPIDFLTSGEIGPMLQCGIILVPRKLIEKSGLWDERLILFNDTEFFTRVILNSRGVKFTRGARLYYRSGQLNSISAQTKRPYFESTFLATCLIGEQLMSFEDSDRIRSLISNMFLSQYYRLFPFYKDLQEAYEIKIREYGNGTLKPTGGYIFKIFKFIFGWKFAKIIQFSIYSFINIPSYKVRLNKPLP